MVGALISLLLYVIILGILIAIVFVIADTLFPTPHQYNHLFKVVVLAIGGLILVLLLLQMLGINIARLPVIT